MRDVTLAEDASRIRINPSIMARLLPRQFLEIRRQGHLHDHFDAEGNGSLNAQDLRMSLAEHATVLRASPPLA